MVIIADDSAKPEWIAADMAAQAEHNPGSAILVTDSKELAARTIEALDDVLSDLGREEEARDCLQHYSAVFVTESMDECVELSNTLAPEHLEILTENAPELSENVRHAGAVFVGGWTPVATGDYVAGPSHVLPTGRTARFSSGLSAADFMKRTSVVEYNEEALRSDCPHLRALAGAEELTAHARSVALRLDDEEE